MKLKVKRLDSRAQLPIRATPGSACYDIYSNERGISGEGVNLGPGDIRLFGTGLAFGLLEDYELEIRPRSGLASDGIVVMNSPGTLDSDYRGELKVILGNFSGRWYFISKGDRIAQIKVNKVIPIELKEVNQLSETERGESGLGSTGR